MTDSPDAFTHARFGEFRRARTELGAGEVLEHDWYIGNVVVDGAEVEVMIGTGDPVRARVLLPDLEDVVGAFAALARTASDAVVTEFGGAETAPEELDDAAQDLRVSTIEMREDGTVVLHLEDTCGQHFLDGYWPAVSLNAERKVLEVSVEA